MVGFLARLVLLCLGVVLALAVAAGVFLLVAVSLTSITAAAASALLVTCAVAAGWSRLGTLGWTRARRRTATRAMTATAALLAVLTAAVVSQPLPGTPTPTVPGDDTRYWDLPTGSRIAYTHQPATIAADRPPVVFVHGGPGVPGEPGGPVLSGPDGLPAAGFDVYVYDQVGAGLSSRLDDARDYTVDRHVADLDAIVEQIGAEQVILIGHSWGGRLVASYLAAHPDRVARAVFEAPGSIYEQAQPFRLSDSAQLLPEPQERLGEVRSPRLALTFLLARWNLQAAREFTGDPAMDAFYEQYLMPAGPIPTCDPALTPPSPAGTGWYAHEATSASARMIEDPRPLLRQVRTPALVLAPTCEFSAWPILAEYRDTLPNATLVVVEGAGHVIQIEQPALLLNTVRAFLLDEDLPLEPYEGREPPF